MHRVLSNGNVSPLVDSADGGLDAKYEYGAFGKTLRVSGTTITDDNPFRFSTKYTDSDGARQRVDGDAEGVARRAEEAGAPWALMRQSGLIYYGFRYYSPSLGRFLNRDPLGELGGTNLYGFVENDPVNGWDYLGLSPDYPWPTYPGDWIGGGGGDDKERQPIDVGPGPARPGSGPADNPFGDSGFHNQGGGDPTHWMMQGVDNITRYLAQFVGEEAARKAAFSAVFLGDNTLLLEALAKARQGEGPIEVIEDQQIIEDIIGAALDPGDDVITGIIHVTTAEAVERQRSGHFRIDSRLRLLGYQGNQHDLADVVRKLKKGQARLVKVARHGGTVTLFLTGVNVGFDIKAYSEGAISGERLALRTIGNAAVVILFVAGSGGTGAVVGVALFVGENAYDMLMESRRGVLEGDILYEIYSVQNTEDWLRAMSGDPDPFEDPF